MKEMLRRDMILTRRGVIPALCLSVILAVLLGAASFAVQRSAAAGRARVQVALVDQEGSLVSRLAVGLVESQSFMDTLLSFDSVRKEADALSGIAEGVYAAAIILPEGYTTAIMEGLPAKGRVVLSEAAAASGDTVAQIASFGQRLLTAGQLGVFAGQQLIWDKGLDEAMDSFLLSSNGRLIELALSVFEKSIQTEVTAYDGTRLSLTAYYALAWLSLFLCLTGLLFKELCTKDWEEGLLQRLYSLGIRPLDFLFGKCLFPFLFRLLLLLPLLGLLSRTVPLTLSLSNILAALLGLAMISVCVSCGYLLLAGRGDATGPLLLLSLFCLTLCGGLIPRARLPRILPALGAYTPFGALMESFAPLFGGTLRPAVPAAGIFWTLLLLGLSLRRLSRFKLKGGAL